MAPRKSRTPDEVLDRRAQLAREYRERNREKINEKARLRMRRRREALQKAPSAIQLDYSVRAAQYRKNYAENHCRPKKLHGDKKKRAHAQTTPPKKPQGEIHRERPPVPRPENKPNPPKPAPATPPKKSAPKVASAARAPRDFRMRLANTDTGTGLFDVGLTPPARVCPPFARRFGTSRPQPALYAAKTHSTALLDYDSVPDPPTPTPRGLTEIHNAASDDSEGDEYWDADDESEKEKTPPRGGVSRGSRVCA
ncbi:hypothetical protein DFH06DRAFT_1322828 [Mycena polygramma]|nr:hypothetical protein DFH06DRAFT_1323338 [Mycena polygramma]KAJ7666857.1 hypothetical protein DFH06DRAFT_1322828 [Mycena polygramma]